MEFGLETGTQWEVWEGEDGGGGGAELQPSAIRNRWLSAEGAGGNRGGVNTEHPSFGFREEGTQAARPAAGE